MRSFGTVGSVATKEARLQNANKPLNQQIFVTFQRIPIPKTREQVTTQQHGDLQNPHPHNHRTYSGNQTLSMP